MLNPLCWWRKVWFSNSISSVISKGAVKFIKWSQSLFKMHSRPFEYSIFRWNSIHVFKKKLATDVVCSTCQFWTSESKLSSPKSFDFSFFYEALWTLKVLFTFVTLRASNSDFCISKFVNVSNMNPAILFPEHFNKQRANVTRKCVSSCLIDKLHTWNQHVGSCLLWIMGILSVMQLKLMR